MGNREQSGAGARLNHRHPEECVNSRRQFAADRRDDFYRDGKCLGCGREIRPRKHPRSSWFRIMPRHKAAESSSSEGVKHDQ